MCSRGRKEEAQKAKKDLEEIKKLMEESGGKLSNRSLQCEVRAVLYYSVHMRSFTEETLGSWSPLFLFSSWILREGNLMVQPHWAS